MLFDLNSLKESSREALPESVMLRERFLQTQEFKVKSLSELCGKLPVPGELIFLWTTNSFNAFTFIPYLLKQYNQIDELIVSTYAINQRIIDAFLRLLETKQIQSTTILISDTMKSMHPKVSDYLLHASQMHDNFNVFFSWNHSKVTLAKCNNEFYIVEGSGNWSENARHEQYIFGNHESIYNFRKLWIMNNQ